VIAKARRVVLEHRAAEECRDGDLMARVDVVHRLALRIHEPEGESRVGIDSVDQIVEIAAARRGEPRPLAVGDRTFTEDGRARSAQAGAPAEPVTAPFPRGQIDFGAELTAGALGIASREQRHAAEHFAVDHGDRPAVVDVGGVHQIPRRHAVHDQADIAERIAADSELAVKVVGGRRRRQRLNRAQGIVEHGAAQRLQFAAVQGRGA
jgi:hypothetical protein